MINSNFFKLGTFINFDTLFSSVHEQIKMLGKENSEASITTSNDLNLASNKILSLSKFIGMELDSLDESEKNDISKIDFEAFDVTDSNHRKGMDFLIEKMKSYKQYTDRYQEISESRKKRTKQLSMYCDVLNIPKTNFNL